MFTDIYFFKSM